MTKSPEFRLTISMNVLEHLGINLYSNVPAVLSEIVANAWDADATEVHVEWNDSNDTINIQDNGQGMSGTEVNDRFLTVGYRRRDHQAGSTHLGRKPMGRKGIGKLSLFSIADHIMLETIRGEDKSAFEMNLEDIRSAISATEGEAIYHPKALSTGSIDFCQGTRITLRSLRKKQTISTPLALRKRIARRFSMIGAGRQFEVLVNGTRITPSDRGYFDKIQYIWTYGDQSAIASICINAIQIPRNNSIEGIPLVAHGWIGTVKESKQLKDEDNENINRIAIFVRDKLAQEDILGDLSERGVYANYLIGELHIDNLDTYDGQGTEKDDDAATSSRQRLVEDDIRYVNAKRFLTNELKNIQNEWSKRRGEAGARQAMEIPAVREWIQSLNPPERKLANQWIGKLNQIQMDNPEDRVPLIRHAIIAFEAHRLNNNLDSLERVDGDNIALILDLFTEVDNIERSMYGQIVRQRIDVIRVLQEKVEHNALEVAIQEYLFDHLWLLDPSWERVEATEYLERRVASMFDQKGVRLSKKELEARIDIKYRRTAGQHVIIELKRPDRRVTASELYEQVRKYRAAFTKLLQEAGSPNEPIEFVIVLGKFPSDYDDPDGVQSTTEMLKPLGARIVFYTELLTNAQKAYKDYLEAHKSTDRLSEILRSIDDFGEDASF